MPRWWWACGFGLLMAVLYTASPLFLWATAAAGLLIWMAGRDLPDSERRLVRSILIVALGVRFALVGAMFLAALPYLNDLSVANLTGDEGYNLSRSLRARDLLLGFSNSRYDYFIATNDYGRSSYLDLMTWVQLLVGPAPFGLRLLNAVLFTTAATVLFRFVRPAFGFLPALGSLIAILSLPTLLYLSISLLKEPLYFLAGTIVLVATATALRASTTSARLLSIGAAAAALWVLDDLRRGAVGLALGGIVCGLAIRLIFASRRRVGAALVAAATAAVLIVTQPAAQQRIAAAIEPAAIMHAGHVFTVGHSYKLLDQGFYMNPRPTAARLALTFEQTLRFTVKAIASFVVTPLPWEVVTRGELAYVPQHVLWYVAIALLPLGIVAGWKRDPLIISLIVGYMLPTALALAMTNGNVGTLVRLRGLVLPYLLLITPLGIAAVVTALRAPWRRPAVRLQERTPLASH